MTTAQRATRRFELLGAAARRTGLSRTTLRRWAAAKLLQLYQPRGPRGRLLLDSDQLDRLIEAGAKKAE